MCTLPTPPLQAEVQYYIIYYNKIYQYVVWIQGNLYGKPEENPKEPMWNILYTSFDIVPYPKGASTHIVNFVRGLVAAGNTLHLITPGDGILPAEDTLDGARVTRLPLNPTDNFLSRSISFGQAVMEHAASAPPYHVSHFRSIWSGFPLTRAKQRYGYKTLFEVNGLPSVELKYHYPGLEGDSILTKVREQELATLALSDAVICPSDVTRAFLVSLGVPSSRITVIPNGYTPRHFETLAPSPIGENPVPTILYIGTLADWQGIQVLVEAMPIVLAEHPARARIIGRGRSRQRKALSKRIRKLGLEEHISLEAALPHHEIPAVIAEADVCVAPLAYNDRNVTQGCCPIKVIEYMGAGRPVVASNLPVVRELAREDVDALLYSPGDADGLARQILRLLQDPQLANRLAGSAAERARENFTWHAAQKKLLEVYRELNP